MIEVSPEFKEAVYAPARRTTAVVTFDISDVDAAEDATEAVTNEAEISRKDQLTDRVRIRPAYATFEPDYWRLDGSFVLPPKPGEPDFQVGWYSDTFSAEDGSFSPHLVMDFTFTEDHSSIGLTLVFDEHSNEYAMDFDIEAYDGSGGLIKSIPIRGNTNSRCIVEEPLENYRRIMVTLHNWNRSERRAKVSEVSFGVVRTYDDDKLISLDLIEEMHPLSERVPSNEFKFVVDNSDREFNILNPDGFYEFLQERQIAEVQLGVEVSPGVVEYVNMGRYYLYDWQSDEGALTTTFTARNLLDFIPEEEVEDLVGGNTDLHSLAVSTLNAAGVEDYVLDPSLSSIFTQGQYKKTTYRKLLQMIAMSGQCVMYVDRNDTFHIERLSESESVDAITFDNIYSEPKIQLDRLVSRVEVNYYSDVDTADGIYTASSTVKGGVTLKVENTLINSQSHAQDIAEWILAESQKRILFDTNWRQNPALECGDEVTIEDVYGANKASRITRQEYSYAGYITGKSKSKGAI